MEFALKLFKRSSAFYQLVFYQFSINRLVFYQSAIPSIPQFVLPLNDFIHQPTTAVFRKTALPPTKTFLVQSDRSPSEIKVALVIPVVALCIVHYPYILHN